MSATSVERLNVALEGRYRIESELGEGGMATVYLAEDIKHERKVALKVLKPELAAVVGAERFLTEIKTTANLSHPHILPLHDSGEADSYVFYVMPHVEGESLRQRIEREKQLPVDEAVRIATAVANALQHAHEKGVIHRDIKPANILIQDGEPLVADFGIALAVGAGDSSRLTETGLSLGTPYYMSPEQATGDQEVGPASDVYALAAVLYEILTGDPPYVGRTAQAVLSKILQGAPVSATAIRKSIPPNVDAAIRKALEKLPADRFATGAEFAHALNDTTFRYRLGGDEGVPEGTARPASALWKLAVAAGLVAVVSGGLGWFAGQGGTDPTPVAQYRVLLGSGPQLMPEMIAFRAALHPEGRGILFGDTTTIDGEVTLTAWWKGRDQVEATRLPSLDGALSPTFSPEGDQVVFVLDRELRKEPLTGGSTQVLATGVRGGTAHALAWLDDGTILFENTDFILQRIAESGEGQADTVSTEDRTGQPMHLAGLPGSWGVLVSACVGSCPAGTMLSLLDLEADTVVKLLDDVVRAWPAPDGHVVYLTRSGDVFSAPLDRGRRELGLPTPLFGGVRVSTDSNGEMHVAPDGTALYISGTAESTSYRVDRVERSGRSRPFAGMLDNFTSLALSPDGRRLAVTIARPDRQQLWVKDPDGPFLPITPFESFAYWPVWYADGSSIAYVSAEGGSHARTVRADGTSLAPDSLLGGARTARFELTGGGDTIVGVHSTLDGSRDVVLVERDAASDTVGLLMSPFDEEGLSLSRDGRWLAYTSNLSGQVQVYVGPFPNVTDARTVISGNGGFDPVWGRNGTEIYYRDSDGWLVAVEFSTDSGFTVEGRTRLFDASEYGPTYDVLPGDQEFLMLAPGPGGAAAADALVLTENIFELVGRGGGN